MGYAYTNVADLDKYLAEKSYITGFQASLDDLAVYQAVGKAPDAKLANAARWYAHITALLNKVFPGKAGGVSGAAAAGGDGGKKKGGDGGKKGGDGGKKGGDKKGGDKAEPTADEKAAAEKKALDKKIKAVLKEGGKKAIDIAGCAEMTLGMDFFCTTMLEPESNVEYLQMAMDAMNVEVDETAEERRGGAGHIGKMLFSAGVEALTIVAYVPEVLQEKIKANEWIAAVAEASGSEVIPGGTAGAAQAIGKAVPQQKFPIKMKDDALAKAFQYLRERNCFPEDDDDDDDDYAFGDDAFDNL